jgi:hypothetical protein
VRGICSREASNVAKIEGGDEIGAPYSELDIYCTLQATMYFIMVMVNKSSQPPLLSG